MVKNDNNKLFVEAQGYGIGKQLKQYTTPGGWRRMLGETFSDSYKNRMNILRDADEQMRFSAKTLKSDLKNLQKSFKDNRYIDVAHWASEINNALLNVVQYGSAVIDMTNEELAEYYTRTEHADIFKDYFGNKKKVKASFDVSGQLQSVAGIADFFSNLLGTSVEKQYAKRMKERKFAVQSLVKQAERAVATVLASFDRMGDARAAGNIELWLKEFERIKSIQSLFENFFKSIYEKYIHDLVELARKTSPRVEKIIWPLDEEPTYEEPHVEVTEPVGGSAPVAELSGTPSQTKVVEEPKKEPEIIPVEQQVRMENHPSIHEPAKNETSETSEAPKGQPGRPRIGDTKRQFNQLEMLLKKLKKQPAEEAGSSPSNVVPEVESKPAEVAPETVKEDKSEVPKVTAPKSEESKVVPESKTKLQPSVKAPKEAPKAPPAKTEPVRVDIDTKPADKGMQSAPEGVVRRQKPSETKPNVKPPEAKPPEAKPVEVKLEEKPAESTESTQEKKKITFVVLPRGGGQNLESIKDNLSKELGHEVAFIPGTPEGKALVDEHIKDNYQVDVKRYDDVKHYGKDPNAKMTKQDIIDLLQKPEIKEKIKSIYSGNNFDSIYRIMGEIPEFAKVDENNDDGELFDFFVGAVQALMKKTKQKGTVSKPESKQESTTESKPKEQPAPKIEEPKAVEEPKVEAPTTETTEEDEEIFENYAKKLSEKLPKPLNEMGDQEIFDLLTNDWYWKMLPQDSSGIIDEELITKLPEYNKLSDDFKQYFLAQIKIKNKNTKSKAVKNRPTYDVSEDFSKYYEKKNKRRSRSANDEVENIVLKYSHKKFFNELNKVVQTNDRGLMAAMLCRYSDEIDDIDPDTSIKLLRYAEKLLND